MEAELEQESKESIQERELGEIVNAVNGTAAYVQKLEQYVEKVNKQISKQQDEVISIVGKMLELERDGDKKIKDGNEMIRRGNDLVKQGTEMKNDTSYLLEQGHELMKSSKYLGTMKNKATFHLKEAQRQKLEEELEDIIMHHKAEKQTQAGVKRRKVYRKSYSD